MSDMKCPNESKVIRSATKVIQNGIRTGPIWDLNKNLVATSRQLTRILKSDEKLPHLI